MRASVASLSKKFISTFFAATLALGLVPAAAFATEDSDDANASTDIQAEAEASAYENDQQDNAGSNETDPSRVISTEGSDSDRSGGISIPAVSQRINQDMTLQTRTVAQAESTRSYFLAQTLESTPTVPIVSANLPLDTGAADTAVEDNAVSEDEDGEDSDESDLVVAPIASESIVVGSFEYRGITYAVEPGGESVVVMAADYSKLPEEFIEAQVIVLPSAVTADGLNYYTVTRIADNAFSTVKSQESEEGITAITIPASITEIGDDAFTGFDTLQYVIVSEDNPNYGMYDGCLYDADQTSLLLIPEGRLGAVRIAPSVTEIDPEVFSHCPSVDTLAADADSAAYQLLEGMENIDKSVVHATEEDLFEYVRLDAVDSEETLRTSMEIVLNDSSQSIQIALSNDVTESMDDISIDALARTGSFFAMAPMVFTVEGETTIGMETRAIQNAKNTASLTNVGLLELPKWIQNILKNMNGSPKFNYYEDANFDKTTVLTTYDVRVMAPFYGRYKLANIGSHTTYVGESTNTCAGLVNDGEFSFHTSASNNALALRWTSALGFHMLNQTTGNKNVTLLEVDEPVAGEGTVVRGQNAITFTYSAATSPFSQVPAYTKFCMLLPPELGIHWNLNGGSYNNGNSIADWRVPAGLNVVLSKSSSYSDATGLPVPTRSGYVFTGWYKGTKTGCTDWSDSNKVEASTIIDEESYLWARWVSDSFSISWVTEHGVAPEKDGYTYGETYELPSLSENGWVFEGWYADAEYTRAASSITSTTFDDKIFYAKWTKKPSLTITLDKNKGTDGANVAFYWPDNIGYIATSDSTTVVGPGEVLVSDLPSRVGFTFEGYYGALMGGTKYVDSDGKLTSDAPDLAEDTTWYARWAGVTYTVTFDSDMDDIPDTTLGLKFDAAMPNLAGTVVPYANHAGYRFAGYYDEDGNKYYNADANGTPAQTKWDKPAPTTLTARWTYDLYFDTNTEDPASVLFGRAAARTNEAVPLSAGRDIQWTLLNEDEFGNVRYRGTDNGQDRVKVTAWKDAKVALPIAQLRSGYDVTQDWGTASTSVYGDRIRYDEMTGVTETALSGQLAAASDDDLTRTLYAIWDVDPDDATSGHARFFYAKLVDQTNYDQQGSALPAKITATATPQVLRVKYDTPLLAPVNLGSTSVKAPSAADGLVFGGYWTARDDNGIAAGTQLTNGKDTDSGNVIANANPWRIAPKRNADGTWTDETSGAPIQVESATYNGETVDAVLVYAKWSLPIHDAITFDLNLGTGDLASGESAPSKPADQTNVQVNVTRLSSTVTPTADTSKYVFDGWWDDPVHGTQYYDAQGYLVDSEGDRSMSVTWPYYDKNTLYAHWTYELYLVENLGTHTATDSVTLASDNSIVNDRGDVKDPALTTVGSGTSAKKAYMIPLTKGEEVTLYDEKAYDTAAEVATLASRSRNGKPTGYVFCGFSDVASGWENTSYRYTAFDPSTLPNTDGSVSVYMCWQAARTPLKFVDTWTHEGTLLDPSKLGSEGGRLGDHSANTGVAYDSMLASYVLPSKQPYIPGFIFDGYYVVRKDGSTVDYVSETGQPLGVWLETKDTVELDADGAVALYARYVQNSYNIGVDYHGGRGSAPEFRNVTYKQALNAGPYKPTRKGYEFAGWYYLCDGAAEEDHVFPCAKCVMFYDKDGYNTSAGCRSIWNIDGDGVLHAAWTPADYTILWSYNYEGAPDAPFAQTKQVYDAKIERPASTPTRPGYSFAGWYTRATGGALVGDDDACVFGQGSYEPADDATTVTYYARWSDPKDYSITLLAGVGGCFMGATPETYAFPIGKGATRNAINIAPRTDAASDDASWSVDEKLPGTGAFTFDGWEEDLSALSEGTSPIPTASLRDNIIPANTDGVHVLVAKWKVNDFTAKFYAYDPDMTEESAESAAQWNLRERMRINATMDATVAGVQRHYGSSLSWTYAAAEKSGTNRLPWNEATAAPVPFFTGYEFLGWYPRGGNEADATKNVAVDPRAPANVEYVAAFGALTYTVHFFVSEGEQEDTVGTAAYDTKIVLPVIASRASMGGVLVEDATANTVTSRSASVYNGWWDVSLLDNADYARHTGWTPGATPLINDIIAADGIELYAEDGDANAPYEQKTHLNLYARQQTGYSFTVPLRAAIMVAVDDVDAPIKVATGAISTETANSRAYRIEAIVCDPIAGDNGADLSKRNPGTDYVFTDDGGAKRASDVSLTLKRAGAEGVPDATFPLGVSTTVSWKDLPSNYTFKKGVGNELALEYGLAFPEGTTPVNFKDHLPVAEGPSYPIARLYYTIGLAPRMS